MYPKLSLEQNNCQKNLLGACPYTVHGEFSNKRDGFFSFQDYGAISTLGTLGNVSSFPSILKYTRLTEPHTHTKAETNVFLSFSLLKSAAFTIPPHSCLPSEPESFPFSASLLGEVGKPHQVALSFSSLSYPFPLFSLILCVDDQATTLFSIHCHEKLKVWRH